MDALLFSSLFSTAGPVFEGSTVVQLLAPSPHSEEDLAGRLGASWADFAQRPSEFPLVNLVSSHKPTNMQVRLIGL